MHIIKTDSWNRTISALEKLFFERIIQRCDYEELISNKHRTVTGYIQVKELIKLCELSFKRDRTVRTLIILLEEARSTNLKQNITNDLIISRYFNDLRQFILNVNTANFINGRDVDLNVIKTTLHKLKVFEVQLDQFYYNALTSEILKIDFKNDVEYNRKAELITSLIDLYIPLLVFKGYSITSISEVLKKWIAKYAPSPSRIIKFFGFQRKDFSFLINLGHQSKEINDFIDLLTEDSPELKSIQISSLPSEFIKKENITENDKVVKFVATSIDPHSQIRNTYDNLLKRILIRRERPSLHTFNDFFDRCYWAFYKREKYEKILLDHDPINVNSRESTLRKTLLNSASEYEYNFKDSDFISTKNDTLRKAIYYYNMSLGSKSIESSLSLLWTSLETILPYRVGTSDIECVQNFVSKSLSFGAVSRDLFSFAVRYLHTSDKNLNSLEILIDQEYHLIHTTMGLKKWFKWLTDGDHDTKYLEIKKYSELLTYLFSKLGKQLTEGNLDHIYGRLKSSEESIRYQLQRIYLHRNQIVHSGDLVSEYSNLWVHLEWYVGKLLAYSVIKIELVGEKKSLESIFIELESEHDYLMSYLELNKKKKIVDSTRIVSLLLKESWQF